MTPEEMKAAIKSLKFRANLLLTLVIFLLVDMLYVLCRLP